MAQIEVVQEDVSLAPVDTHTKLYCWKLEGEEGFRLVRIGTVGGFLRSGGRILAGTDRDTGGRSGGSMKPVQKGILWKKWR